MDLVQDGASIIAEEDRISNLPKDIIYHILTFLDMKYAVQTCTLSRKWKHIWIAMPHLNLNSSSFLVLPQFARFVKHALYQRNNRTKLSAVDLTFTGRATQFFVRSIVNYAYMHKVTKLTVIWSPKDIHVLPQCLFSSPTLKHLTLATNNQSYHYDRNIHIPWNFPVLETLNVTNMDFSSGHDKRLNPFSKCVNLKDITLHKCFMPFVERFTVCAPQLLNLTITYGNSFPKVFNVIAPQLKNLTATVSESPRSCDSLQLSTEGFRCLENVNLTLSNSSNRKEIFVPLLLNLFQELHSAKFLILNVEIIEALSLCLDRLSLEPCPFDKLEYFKIDTVSLKPRAIMPTQVRNYFLENSPNATVIMDLPKKRSWEKVRNEAMAIQMRDEVIVEQKVMFEALKLQHEKLISYVIKCKMEELRVQVENGNPDYEVIRSMGCDVKSVMDLIPENLMVNVMERFSSEYQELKSRFLTCIDAGQWVNFETELRNTMYPIWLHPQALPGQEAARTILS